MDPGALAHALDRVAHTGRVLYVAAHPDDENTRLLAYLANARHLTVAYLSLTRGGGGQNLIGTEQRELLDVIRTQELLAARRIDGAQQRFTRMRDFGYSKNAEETLSKWGREEALSDVVWTIRTFQPDVVITRFDETPPNHGHHTASAILAREAVVAAADPKRFPEQLEKGGKLWKVERLMHNVSPWRGKPPPDALALDVGAYDVRLGMSYGEVAAISRSQHKSQGFGSSGARGELLEHFTHVAGSNPKKDLLEGIPLGWERYGEAAKPFIASLDRARAALTRDTPEKAIPALLDARTKLESLPASSRKREAGRVLDEVILGAAGVFIRATAERPAVSPGDTLPVKVEIVQRRPAELKVASVKFPFQTVNRDHLNVPLEVDKKKELSAEVKVPPDEKISRPEWLGVDSGETRFDVRSQGLVAEPDALNPLPVMVTMQFGKQRIDTVVPVKHVWTDRVHGERQRIVQIAPPATVTPAREAVMLPNGKPGTVVLRVRAWKDAVDGVVRLPLQEGWSATPASHAVELAKSGDETVVRFEVKAPRNAKGQRLSPEIVVGEKTWAYAADVIDYPHIPVQTVFQPSTLRLVPLSVQIPKGLIGYVPGSGDTVAEDLAHLGARVQTVDEQTLRAGDLGKYDAIILGIRAYNTREILRAVQPRLMRYVQSGGTLVVQYNTRSNWDPLDIELAPWPLTIGRQRVTDENAKVTPVNAKHPVLNRPNRLGPEDWEGWVQERGLYFAEKWDDRLVPVLRMNDPGEAPLEGSLLVAEHGKGRYVFTGLSFFRQLPAGVPGAYRLLVNLVDAP